MQLKRFNCVALLLLASFALTTSVLAADSSAPRLTIFDLKPIPYVEGDDAEVLVTVGEMRRALWYFEAYNLLLTAYDSLGKEYDNVVERYNTLLGTYTELMAVTDKLSVERAKLLQLNTNLQAKVRRRTSLAIGCAVAIALGAVLTVVLVSR